MRSVHSIIAVMAAAVIGFAAPSAARAACEQLAVFTVSSGQLLQDIGKRRSSNPGLAVMSALSCPLGEGWSLWTDVWNRFDAGGMRLNETDLEAALEYNRDRFSLQLYAAYFDLPPQPFRQGVVQMYADFGYSFDLGFAKVKPAIRPIQMFGVGGLADLTLLRGRVKIEVPNFGHPALTLAVEPSATYNFTRQPGLPEVSFRPEVALHYDADPWTRYSIIGQSANRHAIVQGAVTRKF